MPRPSNNNRRKTRGLYTTNPKQYLQFQNFDKYEHIYDAQLDYIIIRLKILRLCFKDVKWSYRSVLVFRLVVFRTDRTGPRSFFFYGAVGPVLGPI
jgi:hypothetical protein